MLIKECLHTGYHLISWHVGIVASCYSSTMVCQDRNVCLVKTGYLPIPTKYIYNLWTNSAILRSFRFKNVLRLFSFSIINYHLGEGGGGEQTHTQTLLLKDCIGVGANLVKIPYSRIYKYIPAIIRQATANLLESLIILSKFGQEQHT